MASASSKSDYELSPLLKGKDLKNILPMFSFVGRPLIRGSDDISASWYKTSLSAFPRLRPAG